MINRMNPNLLTFCSAILEDQDLVVSHDRACFYRPTVGVPIMDTYQDKPEWRTVTNLHLDLNPWHFIEGDDFPIEERSKLSYNNIRHWINENNLPSVRDGLISIQGSIYLNDNRESDGGFILVPGFPGIFDQYFRTVPKKDNHPSYSFHYKDSIKEKNLESPQEKEVLFYGIREWLTDQREIPAIISDQHNSSECLKNQL